jgi:predicted dehydrogenase
VSDVVRIAFCGAGMVADLHAAAIARSETAHLLGVFDPVATLAERRADEWSCRNFATFEAMLACAEVDAVFVLSPTEHHVAQAEAALAAGKHVLVEKPVSTSADEAMRLADAARRCRRICMPGHNYAYMPEYRRMRRLAREGSLGTLRFAAVMFAVAHTEEVASHYDGVTWLVLPHHAYLVHGLLGMPASVTAGTTQPAWERLEREDQAWCVLDYPPHGTAMLFTTLGADDDSADPWTFVVKAVGSGGSASASWRSAVLRRPTGSMSLGWVPYEEAYEHELEAFVRAVGGDESGIASPMEDAAAVARIVGAAALSTRRARTIALE